MYIWESEEDSRRNKDLCSSEDCDREGGDGVGNVQRLLSTSRISGSLLNVHFWSMFGKSQIMRVKSSILVK